MHSCLPFARREDFYLAASEPKCLELYDAGHPLDDEATANRLTWPREQLGPSICRHRRSWTRSG